MKRGSQNENNVLQKSGYQRRKSGATEREETFHKPDFYLFFSWEKKGGGGERIKGARFDVTVDTEGRRKKNQLMVRDRYLTHGDEERSKSREEGRGRREEKVEERGRR